MELALAEGEFWELTLRELTRLGKQHQEGIKRADRRAGLLVAMFYNANRGKSNRSMKPADFFPSLREPERRPHEASETELRAKMNNLQAWLDATYPTPDAAT